ncbi:MAG TPA: AmmeMemoRadiSam system protein B [Tangfeifania sp.]|nr:AmmeMemoRadiSam system protein B [Tangfeifania sp.]
MHKEEFQETENRPPEFAGKFYPGTKDALTNQLKELFAKAETNKNPQTHARAIISPHAGYVFSGKVAASAFNQIPENTNYKKVFVIASSHQFLFGGASVYQQGNYETPLGEIPVDRETASELYDSSDLFQHNAEAHHFEHSLEVQLPFLQFKLKTDYLLVPVILGTNNADDCKNIARVLEPYFTPENLFVISTDFSHYPSYNDAIENDYETAEAITSNRPEKLLQVLEENKKKKISHLATSLCGWTSVVTLLYLTEKSKIRYNKIHYQNSGDARLYGDKDKVVGYWAISATEKKSLFSVSEKEKSELLKKARNAILYFLETGERCKLTLPETKGILNEEAGVFVSVYVNNELRGCIGNFAQQETLNDLIQRIAVSASCDRRFIHLKKEEFDEMELEISVLSPLRKIESADEIELGTHGIYIKKGPDSGTFLPQVAKKTGWSLEQFLGHCSRDKAGIGWEGWKNADLYIYEASVFRG